MRQNPMSEQEIKRMRDMLAAGYGTKAIAKELDRHQSTITHRSQRMRYKPPAPKDGLVPPRTIFNGSMREPIPAGEWTPARPGATDHEAIKSRGF